MADGNGIFSSEYIQGSTTPAEAGEARDSAMVASSSVDELEIRKEYGTGKPYRVTIRAKLIND